MRFKIFSLILVFSFLVIFFGLVYIQLIRGGYYYELAERNHIRIIEWDAMRGRIFDRNGKVLADSKLTFDIVVIPQDFRDKNLRRLSEILNINIDKIKKKIKLGYLSPFSPIIIRENATKREALLAEQEKFDLPGVLVQIQPKRYYPDREAGANILGYVGLIDRSRITKLKNYGYEIQDIIGYGGVEEYCDINLRGESGGIQIEVDNRGRQKRVLGIRPTVKGKDIVLTVDSRIQKKAAELLADKRGAIVAMQPYTGEILGMVSSPSFDPNLFTVDNSNAEIKRILNDYRSPMINRAISSSFAPGSVFKIVTAIAALETKKATPNTSFVCNGSLRVGNRSFACWETHGLQNFMQAIIHSCDVYFYSLGLLVGPDMLTRYAKEFGLGSKTQIDLPGEDKGNIPDRMLRKLKRKQDWYKGDTANFAIGQGEILVTPLQATRLVASVANGGFVPTPHIVEYVANEKAHKDKTPGKLPFKQSNLEFVKISLRKVVEADSGTAHLSGLDTLKAAGKTGTAQASNGKTHAWFVGFCPADKPKVAFCVFLEYGGSSHSAVAVAQELLEFMSSEGMLN
ncbi:MAG TPA: penicillin-binding protein 2 [Candidatus Omnitrophota bacterium]|nr:penicillin-binding protein 2 [Candidatus Omnitrophota bacterium]